MLNLYTETAVQPTAVTTSSVLTFDIPRANGSYKKSRSSGRAPGGDTKTEAAFVAHYAASSANLYFRHNQIAPRCVLWRVVEDGRVLELQPAVLTRNDSDTKEAHLTLKFRFHDGLLPGCVSIADSTAEHDLHIFVATTDNEISHLRVPPVAFRQHESLSSDAEQWASPIEISSLSIDSVYRMVAHSPYELFIAYTSGIVQRVRRKANSTRWEPENYDDSSWRDSLGRIIGRGGLKSIEYGLAHIDTRAAQAMAVSADSTYVFTLCLNHQVRVWNLSSGRLAATKDLLDVDRGASDRVHLQPSDQGHLQLARAGHMKHSILVTFSPLEGGQFKFWDVKGGLTEAVSLEDKFPGVKLSAPDPDATGTAVWSLTGFHLSPGDLSTPAEIWVLWRNNNTHKLFNLSFEFSDIERAWESKWVACSVKTGMEESSVEAVTSSAGEVIEPWLEFLFTPARYPTAVIKTAVSMYCSALSLKDPPRGDLKSVLCSVIGAGVALRKYGESTIDYERFAADTDYQWRSFWRIVEKINENRMAPLAFAFDALISEPWVILADECRAVRECSSVELLRQDDNSQLDELEEVCAARWPHRKVVPEKRGFTFRQLATLLTAASNFQKRLSAEFCQEFETAVFEDLVSSADTATPNRLYQIFESTNFSNAVSDDTFHALEADVSLLGGLEGLQADAILAIVDLFAPGQQHLGGSHLRSTIFGKRLLASGLYDCLARKRRILWDLMTLVVFLEGELNFLEAGELAEAISPHLKLVERDTWLACRLRSVPLDFATGGASHGETDREYVVSVLEDARWKAIEPKPAVEWPETYILTQELGEIQDFASGMDAVEYDESTVYLLGNLIVHGEIEAATGFLAFQPLTAWSSYVKGRLLVVKKMYSAAAPHFRKAAYSLACGKAAGDVSLMSAGLITLVDAECFYNGLPRYLQHILNLFDSARAYGEAAQFATLALQALQPGQKETVEGFRTEVLSRLFTAELKLGRYHEAFEALIQFSDRALQASDATSLIDTILAPDNSAQSVAGAVATLQSLAWTAHPQLAKQLDVHLVALAKKQKRVPGSAHTWTTAKERTDYVKVVSSLRVAQHDFRGAATVLYARLQLLRQSGRARSDPHATTLRYTLLTLINLMSLVASDEAYILAEDAEAVQGADGEDGEDGGHGRNGVAHSTAATGVRKKRKIIVTLSDLRREYDRLLDRCSRVERGDFDFDHGADALSAVTRITTRLDCVRRRLPAPALSLCALCAFLQASHAFLPLIRPCPLMLSLDRSARVEGGRDVTDSATDGRTRPRTYPYFSTLPYAVEDEARRQHDLAEILKHLYVAVQSGDFAPGAVHWTRELRSWLSLKFDPTKEQRVALVQLYYELALAPGIDPGVAERFASMFMILTKRKHYLRPVSDLSLDWRPLYREIKVFVIPAESGLVQTTSLKRNIKMLVKICSFAQLYFDPRTIPDMLDEILPHFSLSFAEGAFVVTELLNLLLPTAAPPADRADLLPQRFLPTYFHLWSLVSRSRIVDIAFLDLFSRMARDSLASAHMPFGEFGLFSADQATVILTAVLRLLEIPVGQSTSPYSATVDLQAGMAILLDRDARKHPVSHHIARWFVMSMSPKCLDEKVSVLSLLENLIQAIETFFHPSNSGAWTKTLAQLVFYLADFFVMRWNRERNGEMEVPAERQLTAALRRRFVLCLRDVIFMGIYAKSNTAMSYSLSTLHTLAVLEPDLILPGALQRIYPSMQGLVEVHRTISSLRSLQVLARTMIRTKGYRCHITALLGLALPGIDANDLEKTLYTLSFFANVCYNIPFQDLSGGREDVDGNLLALEWIGGEMEKMEHEGASVVLNYADLDDKDEERILASSTAGFAEFVDSFLARVFTLLENLPDATRIRSGSPEENIVNTLPAAFMPLLSSLSPDLYDMALNKIVDFVANHVIHQSRDAMAFICNCVCKVNPEKALAKFVPVLIRAIRTEIDENGAGSTRNAASDVLPRDRGLVWNISMLSMCIVHVGGAVLNHKQDLFDIAIYMQQKCKGMPTVHVSNYIHHLLLNLTGTFAADYALYEPDKVENGITADLWGLAESPKTLRPRWHVPTPDEIAFAVELFQNQAQGAIEQLKALVGPSPPVKRDGSGKEWSDEVSRNLVLLRLLIAGISVLFDAQGVNNGLTTTAAGVDPDASSISHANGRVPEKGAEEGEDDDFLDGTDETTVKPSFHYPTGYLLTPEDQNYILIHRLRQDIGRVLHDVHVFLTHEGEDDVSSFAPLYTAYRSWFLDVGIERSAHVLDRVTRLLQADEQPYKQSGIHKDYPRAVLVRRANVYHTQRLKHNASPRPRSDLDEILLLDLAESSVSLYTEVRRNAQSAGESALRVVFGARLFVIPPLLDAFKRAVKSNDFGRIKGCLFSLLFGSLAKTVGRHWKYTPDVIRTFIQAASADKPSIQKLCTGGLFQVMEYGRNMDRMAIVDQSVVEAIAPVDRVQDKIDRKKQFIVSKRTNTELKKSGLAEELIELARNSHWKIATRIATIVMSLGMRFDYIASDNMIDLVARGTIDSHPGLRGLYSQALVALFTMTDVRAVTNHDYANYIQGIQDFPAKVKIATAPADRQYTTNYLAAFAQPEAEVYIDHDYPGWLVWSNNMPGYKSNIENDIEYDQLEWSKRTVLGKILNRDWFKTFFNYLKQEPRDSSADKFRMASAMMLTYCFELIIRDKLAAATFDDIKEETLAVFGNGSEKHQHRAAAEILAGLITSVMDTSIERRTMVWEFTFPILQRVFSEGLTPENSGYWTTFLHMILQSRDPRRAWPLVEWLTNFRLDMSSNAAFKESSKIHLLHQVIIDAGWHFQLDKPITENFLAHIDHPYKGVREAMAQTLAAITRSRYHESYQDVDSFLEAQREAGPIGTQPYVPTAEFDATIHDIFARIETWRHERAPGQQTPSAYTSGSKTVLLWLDSMLSSHECIQLVRYFPDVFTEQLLHMMDIKEDPELQSLAYHVFRHLPNIPHRMGEDEKLVDSLIRIGRTSPSWHQRLRVMINMQIVFFRRLFLLSESSKQKLFDCVASMLEDAQHEVRAGAATTLSGMIRCSPLALRQEMIHQLSAKFTKMLADNPLPKKARGQVATLASVRSSGTATPTPEHQRLVVTRHAAVLGLGSLIQAFPYSSPPPSWMPDVLITLSVKAAGDPGMVGSSVKNVISDFKKTRQDTWHIDVKAFKPDQLEDLSGVLWKSYFA
ncbi:hypothetical protein DV736_g2949, partial [Chaetothyriales sp. CBS 134916]